MDAHLRAMIEEAREAHFVKTLERCYEEEQPEPRRFALLEHGRDEGWLSFHDTPEDAGAYSVRQEYAEDWAPAVLLDTQTGETFTPETIVWTRHA